KKRPGTASICGVRDDVLRRVVALRDNRHAWHTRQQCVASPSAIRHWDTLNQAIRVLQKDVVRALAPVKGLGQLNGQAIHTDYFPVLAETQSVVSIQDALG